MGNGFYSGGAPLEQGGFYSGMTGAAAPIPTSDDVEWADYAKAIMSGGASIVQGVGWLANVLGAEDIGTSIETLGADAVDYWNENLSDPAKREIAKQVVRKNEAGEYEWGDPSLSTIGLMGAQSLLGTAAGMGVGAGITKVLQVFANPMGRSVLTGAVNAGKVEGASAKAVSEGIAAGKKLRVMDAVLGAGGFGVGEGSIGGISAGASVYDNIMNLPSEKLLENDRYRQVYESTDTSRSEVERHQYAADTVAKEASSAAGWESGLTTALLGAPMGAYFGRILGGAKLSATLPRGIATGAAGEAAQEFAQSGVEQYISNIETGEFDDSIQPFDDVLNAAVSGALAGALLGGGFGVAGVGPAKAELAVEDVERRKAHVDNLNKIGGPVKAAVVSAGNAGVDPVPVQNIVADWASERISMAEALENLAKLEREATTGEPAVADKPPPPGPDDVLAETASEAAEEAPAEAEPEPALTAVAPEIEEAAQQELIPEEATAPDLETINLLDMNVDAATFQFKGRTDEQGVSKALQGVKKFDKTQAGVAIVYEDMNGDQFIVDGHQRVNLAKKLAGEGQAREDMEVPAYILRASEGITPEAATLTAAIKNIGEGSGSAIDAAKVLRQIGPEGEAEMPTLPPNAALVKQAKGLRNLDDDAFAKAINEVIPERQAAIVGEMIPEDADLQNATFEVLRQTEPANDTQTRAIVAQVRTAGVEVQQTEDLFGEQALTESLYLERAKVLDSALRSARRDKATFRTLTNRENVIAQTGENVLDTEANLARMTEAEQAVSMLSTLANQKGPISDALSEAAREVKAGAKPGTVAKGFLKTAVAQIQGRDQARRKPKKTRQRGTAELEPAEALMSRRSPFDTPRTKAMQQFLEKEKDRVTGLSIEDDGVFIYTDSSKWSDDAGSGTFREDSETAAIKAFYDRVQKVEPEEDAEAAKRREDLEREIERRDRARNTGQQDLFSRPGIPLSQINLTREFEIEDTGEIVEVEQGADVLLRQLDKRISVIEKLRTCVRG